MENMILNIDNLIKSNVKTRRICQLLSINLKELRKILLENELSPCVSDKEYEYFTQAMELKQHMKDIYFIKELVNLIDLPLTRIRMICSMYDLKPKKKSCCIICGKVIENGNTSKVKKYCSRSCSNKGNYSLKQEIKHRNCLKCGKEFVANGNQRYCSKDCKDYSKLVRESIKWLGK